MRIFRPDYWSKNVLIVISYIFTLQIIYGSFNSFNLVKLILIIISFSVLTSSCYVINEYLDKDEDAYHPEKKKRILVNSNINSFNITIIHFFLLTVSFSILYQIEEFDKLSPIFIFYLINAYFYNLKPIRLKNLKILDVFSEGLNSPIRFLVGWFMVVDNLPPITLVIIFYSLGIFLMTAKRFIENRSLKKNIIKKYRKSLEFYNYSNFEVISNISIYSILIFLIIFIYKYNLNFLLAVPFYSLFFLRLKKNIFEYSIKSKKKVLPFLKDTKSILLILIILLMTIGLSFEELPILSTLRVKSF